MRILFMALLIGMVSAGFKLGGTQGTSASTLPVEQRMQLVADKLNAAGPKQLGNGMTMTTARAEGRIMHINITGVPDYRDMGASEDMMRQAISGPICADGHTKMFEDGGMIKVHMQTPGGGWLPDLLIDHCGA